MSAGGPTDPIDAKYVFAAVSREHGTSHSHRDALLFLAHDIALPETLRAYLKAVKKRGASANQRAQIDSLIMRVEAWQAAHPEAVKVCDWDPEAVAKRERQAAITRGAPTQGGQP